MSGKHAPRRKLFDWCETCAGRVMENGVLRQHQGHQLIQWTSKDQETVMNFTRMGL